MARWSPLLLAATLLATAPTARATVLFHDTWYDGAEVALQLGNCPSECDAVVLTPSTYPFSVNYVYAIAGPDGASLSFDVVIYGVNGMYPDRDQILGGADDVEISLPQATWFEVDLQSLGTPAVIESGSFAVAFCFKEHNNPCNVWGLGSDEGPPVIPVGGVIWVDPTMGCLGGACVGGGGDWSWVNLSTYASRNWIIRAADAHWEPGDPTDDDDTGDDDTADDDTGDDDTGDDDTGDDDTDDDTPIQVTDIEPAVINEGEPLGFLVTGQGFDDNADLFIGQLRVMPVDVENSETIEGVFPEGLEPGYYNVCVENPDSEEDCLLNGLEVVSEGGCGGCGTTPERTGSALGLALAALLLLVARRHR